MWKTILFTKNEQFFKNVCVQKSNQTWVAMLFWFPKSACDSEGGGVGRWSDECLSDAPGPTW